MGLVICKICGFTADLDFVDMVDLADGYAHPDCLPDNEPMSLALATCADAEESNESKAH